MSGESLNQNSHKPRLLWIGGAIVVFFTLFSGKPFHIDDVYFLEIAENILKHPIDPFYGSVTLVDDDYRVFKNTGRSPNTFDAMSHPPLVPYIQTGAAYLSGGFHEIPLHLTFIVFPILCALSAYFLANRFTASPLISTLLFLTSPLFLVNSTNLMSDIPMLGLGLSSLSCFIYGLDRQKFWWLLLAGMLAGFAMLARYVAIGLIPLFVCYAIIQRKIFTQVLWTLGPAILIFGLWCLENWMHHGGIHLIASSKHYSRFYENLSFSPAILLQKMISSLSAIGGTSVFAFLFLFLRTSNRKRTVFLLLATFLLTVVLLIFRPLDLIFLSEYSSFQLALLILYVNIGFFFCIAAISARILPEEDSCISNSDRAFLLIWFLGTMAASILILPFGTGRYMLPVLLPLIFLLILEIRSGALEHQRNKVFGTILIAVTFTFSTLLAIADYQHASSYKNLANDLKHLFPGSKIWFVGDWGFRYYMRLNGYQYLLSTDNSPIAGDLIVQARIAGLHDFSPSLHARSLLIKTVSIRSDFPLRLMCPQVRAGFYAHGFGLLPFNLSKAPLEEFSIYKVDRLATD